MVGKEIILKKIEQIKTLSDELRELLEIPFEKFIGDFKNIRSAERNFQLIVDMAIDINSQIIVEKGKKTPDTYKQSFLELGELRILPQKLAQSLAVTASLRNILVHEYDFEEDYKKFYDSAKRSLNPYEEYCRFIYEYATRK